MRQSASLTAGSRDASSTGDRKPPVEIPTMVERIARRLFREEQADFPQFTQRTPFDALDEASGVASRYRRLAAAALDELEKYRMPDKEASPGLFDHQNAPTDDATGQRSGLSP